MPANTAPRSAAPKFRTAESYAFSFIGGFGEENVQKLAEIIKEAQQECLLIGARLGLEAAAKAVPEAAAYWGIAQTIRALQPSDVVEGV